MEEILQQSLTYRQFRDWEFDDHDPHLYELINGQLVQKQSPKLRHQRVSRNISRHLDAFALRTDLGEMLYAPLDVVLDDNNAYHPDVLFIKKERDFIYDEKDGIVMGAPDLVVEILSKSTAGDDRGEKMVNYEKYGVREYWLVDPLNNSVEVYTIENQRYKLISYLTASTAVLKSRVLEGFEMSLAQIFPD